MNYKSLILLLALMYSCFHGSSQTALDSLISIQSGKYQLKPTLQTIKNSGIPLAFSTNKLPNVEVSIRKGESIRNFLERHHEEEIFSHHIENSQILITKYQPRKFTLNGLIRDTESNEHLIGANIQIKGTDFGGTTNGYGYYSITLKEGEYNVIISHIGYKSYRTKVDLKSNTYFSFSISPNVVQLEEVEISSISNDANITSNIPSVSRISVDQGSVLTPYLLGEVDVVQNALLQPGIKAIGEDAGGIHIRGGRVDQNLVLLDEAPIYNPIHVGQVSVFNPEAINDVRIFKGFIPPAYGGRASSVIEVRQREGNKNENSFSGGIGLLSARLLAEGPIKKGKSSFLASARHSLFNPSIESFGNTSVRRSRIRFRDLNLKINSNPNERNTYYLSGYSGKDRNSVGFNSIRNWGNSTVNFRWNHLFTPKVFSNFSAFISEYTYKVENEEKPGAFVSTSKIVDYSIKSDFTYSFNPTNEINFGFSSVFHRLKPGDREPFDVDANTNTIRLDTEHGLESGSYISQQIKVGPIGFNYGFRYSMFHNFGPEEVRRYAPNTLPADSSVIDTVSFSPGELIKFYHNLEPRAAINWKVSRNSSVKISYSKTVQYLHLLSNTRAPAPTDIWKLADTFVPPTVSQHYSIGFYKNLQENMWESSIEFYFKDIDRDISYRNGADLVFNENIETELLFSEGRAYGMEIYFKKKYGKLTGWLSYSLSRSETRFEEDGQAKFLLNDFDKTHDFSTTWALEISERASASSNFIFATGIPVTLPSDKYSFENNLVPHFVERNQSRLPSYHRLDLSFKWKAKKTKKDGSARKNENFWVFTLYNVYARRNVNSYFFQESNNNPGLGEIVEWSIFGGIVPGITYSFKF
ncbi:MAG: carboxypeptidase-like regulatory domain-containing protein [Cyclobacteriaceae bacterium]